MKTSPDDEVDNCLKISDNNNFDSQPSQFDSSNITTPIVNATTTPTLNTVVTPRNHSDDMKSHIKSLEDKLHSKIAALKSHLFINNFGLRNYITLQY